MESVSFFTDEKNPWDIHIRAETPHEIIHWFYKNIPQEYIIESAELPQDVPFITYYIKWEKPQLNIRYVPYYCEWGAAPDQYADIFFRIKNENGEYITLKQLKDLKNENNVS